MGAEIKDIPKALATYLKIKVADGALITHVRVGGPAFDAGLFPGDIIVGANHQEVHNAKDLAHAIQSLKASDTAVLYVMRGPKEKLYVPVKLRA
jgi:serine protease Do